MSGAGPWDVYYDAHLTYLHRLTLTVRSGASIVWAGAVGQALRHKASEYPVGLFSALDADLQAFARDAQYANVGVSVPPVLAIVLSRIKSRDESLQTLLDLRAEWKEARDRVWKLLDALRQSSDPREMREIRAELDLASLALSPDRNALVSQPTQVLWNLVKDGVEIGAVALAGERLATGAAVVGAAIRAAKHVRPVANYLFRRGALDLARRVRVDLIKARRVPDLLDRFLTEDERRALSS